MPPPPGHQPLNDAELDTIERFLLRGQGPIPNLEVLDGCFTALVVGPELVMPSRYLPLIVGGDDSDAPHFESMAEANAILTLLMRHWNAIAAELHGGGARSPLVAEEEADSPGCDWSIGFLQGVELAHGAWRPFLEDDALSRPMLPIFMLANEHNPDPTLRPPPITPEQRDELLLLVTAGTRWMYSHFLAQRVSPPVRPRKPKQRRPRPRRRR